LWVLGDQNQIVTCEIQSEKQVRQTNYKPAAVTTATSREVKQVRRLWNFLKNGGQN
jgi:hypothetical protein